MKTITDETRAEIYLLFLAEQTDAYAAEWRGELPIEYYYSHPYALQNNREIITSRFTEFLRTIPNHGILALVVRRFQNAIKQVKG